MIKGVKIYHQPFLGLILTSLLIFFTQIASINGTIYVLDSSNDTKAEYEDMEFAFARPVPPEGVYAKLVLADPPNACETLLNPRENNSGNFRWFAIANREDCSYMAKAKNAQSANFDGIILFVNSSHNDNELLNATVHSYTKAGGYPNYNLNAVKYEFTWFFSISVLFVAKDAGRELSSKYLFQDGFYLRITSFMEFDLNDYLVPFAIVIGICLFVLISFVVIHIVRLVRHNQRSKRKRLSKKNLKDIRVIRFSKSEPYETCAICLDEYVENEKLRVLPCGHAYHKKCIDPWLTKKSRACPICKSKIILPGMELDSEDEESDAGQRIGPSSSVSETTPLISSSADTAQRYVTPVTPVTASNRNMVEIYVVENGTMTNDDLQQPQPPTFTNRKSRRDLDRLLKKRFLGITRPSREERRQNRLLDDEESGENIVSRSEPTSSSTSSESRRRGRHNKLMVTIAPSEHSVNAGDYESVDDVDVMVIHKPTPSSSKRPASNLTSEAASASSSSIPQAPFATNNGDNVV